MNGRKSWIWLKSAEWRIAFFGGNCAGALAILGWAAVKKAGRMVMGRRNANAQRGISLESQSMESPRKKGKRILMASHDALLSSGAFRSCAAMAKLLQERHGYDVTIVLAQHGDGEESLREAGLRYIVIPSAWWLVDSRKQGRRSYRTMCDMYLKNSRAIRAWLRLIDREKPDLIHVNSMSAYVGGLAALRAGIPLVWHMRDLLEEDHNLQICDRNEGYAVISNADRMIAVSQCVWDKYAAVFGQKKTVKVLNGVDTKRFLRPEHCILRGDKIVVAFLGNLQRKKGPVEFAMACAEAYGRGAKNIEVWFIGEDQCHLRGECDGFFEKAGMLGNVKYWGLQKRPEDLLAKADAAVVSSKCEAFGRVTVEMMLSGCLVFGADTGGTKELIEDGETGYLFRFREGSFSDLPDKMLEAFADKDRSRTIAKRGQEYMAKNMTAERNADGVAAVYEEVFKERMEQEARG